MADPLAFAAAPTVGSPSFADRGGGVCHPAHRAIGRAVLFDHTIRVAALLDRCDAGIGNRLARRGDSDRGGGHGLERGDGHGAAVVVLLFERTFLRRSFVAALHQSWQLYVGLCATWGLLVVLNLGGSRSQSAGFHLGVPAHAWWLTQTHVLLLYLKLIVWPWPLVIHYEFPYLHSLADAWPWFLPAALLGLATLVLVYRRTATGFTWAAALLVLLPTLTVPIITEIAAERRMYLPWRLSFRGWSLEHLRCFGI